MVFALLSALGFYWLTSADALASGGNLAGGPGTVGHTLYSQPLVSPAGSDRVSVRLTSATPRTVENTADADIRVLLCVVNGQVPEFPGSATPPCTSTAPFTAGSRVLGSQAGLSTLILAITPRRPGIIRIDGLTVHYRDGIRRGTAHCGINLELRAIPR